MKQYVMMRTWENKDLLYKIHIVIFQIIIFLKLLKEKVFIFLNMAYKYKI